MIDNQAVAILHNALARFQAHEQELGQLDAAAGDGDHGATMVRGLMAAVAAVDAQGPSSPGELLVCAGDAFADAAGGAAGALFGALFCTVGRKLAGADTSPAAVSAALEAGLAAVAKLGKAAPGDKTLLDALAPFVHEFAAAVERGEDTAHAWSAALPAAAQGAAATADMVARRGRSARLGERSRGHIDPGAQSVVYLLAAANDVLQAAIKS
jgi:dihydroxyacetone kinase